MLHDNPYMQTRIYEWFGIDPMAAITSKNIFIKILLIALIIYIVGLIIEAIRQGIFKFIKKRKISQKLSEKFYKYLDNY